VRGRLALTAATIVALAGPALVLAAFGSAGGGDRERPHVGLLERGVGCLDDERDYRLETTVPALSCPDIAPPGVRAEYRTAWIGLALGLVGAAVVLALVALRSTPSHVAYGVLALVAGVQFVTAAGVALASFDLEITSGGSVPTPRDAFDRVARWLFVAALALVPLGALARRLPHRGAQRGSAQRKLD
jgi:hypothetical protein